jgi:hypothetical protein
VILTRYNALSIAELLRELEDKRMYSELVEELCQRLENLALRCPVCDADILKAKRGLE